MFQKFMVLFPLLLAACAPMPTAQVAGTGRFLQMSTIGHVFIQMDMNSLAACREEVATMKTRNEKVDIICHTVSYGDMLPYSMTSTNILTGAGITIRTQTMDACTLMGKEILKLPNASHFKLSECSK